MYRLAALVGCVTLAVVLVVPSGSGQEKDKTKGILPQYFKNLNLTATQKEAIYKLQKETKDKLKELDEKKDQLKAAEKTEIMKVLTEEQKKLYLKLVAGDSAK
jgi:flagellar motility protein MotE (MotC chaperone)